MWHLGSFRMYEPVLRDLAGRGHEIHLALGRSEALGWRKALDTLVADHPDDQLGLAVAADRRLLGRAGQDHPAVGGLPALLPSRLRPHADPEGARRRAAAPPPRVDQPSAGVRRSRGNRQRLVKALRLAGAGAAAGARDRAGAARSPAGPGRSSRRSSTSGSSQFEVLRSALAQGIRTAYAVGSWDHLSSKALIRDMPQRVFVWNDTQKDEAVRLHGVPPERVVVTGAQCYDQWFGRRPVRSRDAFCGRVGPAGGPARSSSMCARRCSGAARSRPQFVKRWVQSLRDSAEPALRNAAILIRPHPARMDEWQHVDLSGFEHVSLYGSNPVDDASKDDYFESLFYSAAVVGLEHERIPGGRDRRPAGAHGAAAGVPGEPGRRAALPLSAAASAAACCRPGRTFEEHHAQLAASIERPASEPGAGFVRAFVRPRVARRARDAGVLRCGRGPAAAAGAGAGGAARCASSCCAG